MEKWKDILISNVLAMTVISLLVFSCASHEYGYEYIKMDELESDEYNELLPIRSGERQYGALGFHRSDGESRYYAIRKRHKNVYAETLLHRGENRDYFFSFGLDTSANGPTVGFKIEY